MEFLSHFHFDRHRTLIHERVLKMNSNNKSDDEFKTGAVKMVIEKGRTISSLAMDLGVSNPAGVL